MPVATAIAKTTIHEIGHQLLHTSTHRGDDSDVGAYYNLTGDQKDNYNGNDMNIMNADAVGVPMDNPTATIPAGSNYGGVIMKEGNNAGPIDRFFFALDHIVDFRKRHASP